MLSCPGILPSNRCFCIATHLFTLIMTSADDHSSLSNLFVSQLAILIPAARDTRHVHLYRTHCKTFLSTDSG